MLKAKQTLQARSLLASSTVQSFASSSVQQQKKSQDVDRSHQMSPFAEEDPFNYKVTDDEYKGFKLRCFHEPTSRNPRALLIFIPDFAVTARSFGNFFSPFAADSDLAMRTYSFDRRGFGKS